MVQGATTKDGPLYFFRFGNTIFTCNLVITYLEDCCDVCVSTNEILFIASTKLIFMLEQNSLSLIFMPEQNSLSLIFMIFTWITVALSIYLTKYYLQERSDIRTETR